MEENVLNERATKAKLNYRGERIYCTSLHILIVVKLLSLLFKGHTEFFAYIFVKLHRIQV